MRIRDLFPSAVVADLTPRYGPFFLHARASISSHCAINTAHIWRYNANNVYSCPAFPHRANRSSKEQQYPLLNGCGGRPLRRKRSDADFFFFLFFLYKERSEILPRDNYTWKLRLHSILLFPSDLRPFLRCADIFRSRGSPRSYASYSAYPQYS